MGYAASGQAMQYAMDIISEIYDNTLPGDHMMAVISDDSVISCYFRKHNPVGITLLSGHVPSVLLDIVDQNVAMRGYSAFTLRSMLATGIEEVRGWIIQPDSMKTVKPDDLIDAYCYDTSSEKIVSPKANVRYSDTW